MPTFGTPAIATVADVKEKVFDLQAVTGVPDVSGEAERVVDLCIVSATAELRERLVNDISQRYPNHYGDTYYQTPELLPDKITNTSAIKDAFVFLVIALCFEYQKTVAALVPIDLEAINGEITYWRNRYEARYLSGFRLLRVDLSGDGVISGDEEIRARAGNRFNRV